MSRIGKAAVPVPSGVEVTVAAGTVTVKGPKGTLSRVIPGDITISQDERHDSPSSDPTTSASNKALHGLTRSLVNNMVIGVTEGFKKELQIVGVGYRAEAQGPSNLRLNLGFSHPVDGGGSRGHHVRGAGADAGRRVRDRQGSRRPGGRQHP